MRVVDSIPRTLRRRGSFQPTLNEPLYAILLRLAQRRRCPSRGGLHLEEAKRAARVPRHDIDSMAGPVLNVDFA